MANPKVWLLISTVYGFLGVALGAFGAHALKPKFDAYALDVYQTAVLYQFVHTLALMGWALWMSHMQKTGVLTGLCFTLGILIFSGSLYVIAITGIKTFGAIAPIGGTLFLVGWLSWAYSICTSASN